MLAKRFEDLRIWQSARALTVAIYAEFGQSRDFGFRDQITRAAVSVMNNIAEGFDRTGPNDFIRFLNMAKGSCAEVRSMLYAAEDLSMLMLEKADTLRKDCMIITKGIASLIASIKEKNG